MISRTLFLIAAFLTSSGCELELFNRAPATPIGHSRDENSRPCATYKTKSEGLYETLCDYGGQYPASVNNPLSNR